VNGDGDDDRPSDSASRAHNIATLTARLRTVTPVPQRARHVLAGVPDHLRAVVRIARWEVSRTAGTVSRSTLVVALLGAVVAGAVGPALLGGGVSLEDGIYRVGVAEDSPYHAVAENDPQFVARGPSRAALEAGQVELLVTPTGIDVADSRKGRAALAAFRTAVQAYNDDRYADLSRNGTPTALTFPVAVTLRYESRALVRSGGSGGEDGGDADDSDGGNNGDGSGDGLPPGFDDPGSDDGGVAVPNLGGALTSGTSVGAPSGISPPFPFGSLVLAFLFVIPMNFVIQAYGSTVMNERINRRGELLLVAPVAPGAIVAGKTLPYLLTLVGVTVVIALAIGGGSLSVLAVIPVAMLFLAATFVGGMFARSFKELTFVTLTVSVFLTSYVFVPAIFTEITPIALISPLTLVVRDLQGTGATPLEFAFSTGPFALTALVLFTLGAGVYREEDMFTQRPVHLKALDALAARVKKAWHVAPVTGFLIPFVFLAELLGVALLYPVARSAPFAGVLVTLVVVAGVEEVAKSVVVYAGYEHARYDRSLRTAAVVGAFAGAGFFLGEKFTLVVQTVGLTDPNILTGAAAFPETVGSPGPLLALGLLLAPLALHTVTAAISAAGARRGSDWYVAGLATAVLVHVAYNFTVLFAAFNI
jgi:ABC-type Na+ efflux pump permease subunit